MGDGTTAISTAELSLQIRDFALLLRIPSTVYGCELNNKSVNMQNLNGK